MKSDLKNTKAKNFFFMKNNLFLRVSDGITEKQKFITTLEIFMQRIFLNIFYRYLFT